MSKTENSSGLMVLAVYAYLFSLLHYAKHNLDKMSFYPFCICIQLISGSGLKLKLKGPK